MPGIGDRPGIGGKPGSADRIGDKPGDRPICRRSASRDRPARCQNNCPVTDRLSAASRDRRPAHHRRNQPGHRRDRPGIGDRPIIGGGNNIGNKIGSGNVGNWIGNDFNFNFNNVNNFNRPGWGYGGGDRHNHWGDHWYDHHIHGHHHGWYHGCWSGHWGNYWYVPVAVGATYWGFSALTGSWGYGYNYGYVNPYYTTTVVATAPAYDYSQPIVINNYVESGDQNVAADAPSPAPAAQAPAPAESSDEQAGYSLLDKARDAFERNDYKSALNLTEQAVRKVPNDPVIHEFGALCLFALGDYQRSAVVLNALLAVAPGMDWTTLISLYSSSDEYTEQLRALEAHCKQKPNDSAAAFVLAYHYLVCGHADSAKSALQRVVAAQPNDQVAKRMYDALKGDDETPAPPAAEAETPAAKPAVEPKPETAKPDEVTLTTDLVGQWHAERDGNAFDLTIDEQGEFTWKATPKGKEPTTISGKYSMTDNALVMDSADQGTMAGRVTSGGPDQFQFVIAGGPPGDKGLTFQRVKTAP